MTARLSMHLAVGACTQIPVYTIYTCINCWPHNSADINTQSTHMNTNSTSRLILLLSLAKRDGGLYWGKYIYIHKYIYTLTSTVHTQPVCFIHFPLLFSYVSFTPNNIDLSIFLPKPSHNQFCAILKCSAPASYNMPMTHWRYPGESLLMTSLA